VRSGTVAAPIALTTESGKRGRGVGTSFSPYSLLFAFSHARELQYEKEPSVDLHHDATSSGSTSQRGNGDGGGGGVREAAQRSSSGLQLWARPLIERGEGGEPILGVPTLGSHRRWPTMDSVKLRPTYMEMEESTTWGTTA
jgi:hypothetical protein